MQPLAHTIDLHSNFLLVFPVGHRNAQSTKTGWLLQAFERGLDKARESHCYQGTPLGGLMPTSWQQISQVSAAIFSNL